MRKPKVSTTILICVALVGLTGAFTVGTFFGKNLHPKIDAVVEERDAWKETAEKYKKIAASHEVEIKAPEHKWDWPKVDSLRYDDTIDHNFERLERDLKEYEGKRIKVQIEIWTVGQWARWLSGRRNEYVGDQGLYTMAPNWKYESFLDPTKFSRITRDFEGTNKDIIQEFKTHISNDQWGFWVGGAKTNEDGSKSWGWARPNASITFKVEVFERVSLDIDPEIKYVQVLVKEPDDELRKKAEEEVERLLGAARRKQSEANR